MPGLSGEQVLESLLAREAELSVVLVSGLQAHGPAVGDARVVLVQKPMKLSELCSAVRSVTTPRALRSSCSTSHRNQAGDSFVARSRA